MSGLKKNVMSMGQIYYLIKNKYAYLHGLKSEDKIH